MRHEGVEAFQDGHQRGSHTLVVSRGISAIAIDVISHLAHFIASFRDKAFLRSHHVEDVSPILSHVIPLLAAMRTAKELVDCKRHHAKPAFSRDEETGADWTPEFVIVLRTPHLFQSAVCLGMEQTHANRRLAPLTKALENVLLS